MGRELTRAGYDYTIFEKSDGVGGTWRDNAYPGAKCDVPSHLYSYSRALNPWWSHATLRVAAGDPRLSRTRCTDQFGVRPHVRTNTAIVEGIVAARRSPVGAARRSRARPSTPTCSSAASACSTFLSSRASRAPSSFAGAHVPFRALGPRQAAVRGRTGRVDRDRRQRHPIRARHVAPEVEHLTVFQRTPIWITPRIDQPFTPEEQRRFARVRARGACSPLEDLWWVYERATFAADSDRQTHGQTELARSYLERKIARPRAARQADAGLPGRLQTSAHVARVVPGAHPPRTCGSSRVRSVEITEDGLPAHGRR